MSASPTLSPTLPESTTRTGWPQIAIAAGLLLASGLTIVNSVQLARLAAQNPTSTQNSSAQQLAARIDALEQQAEAAKQSPKPLMQADFDSARQVAEQRLSQLEQIQATDARSDDVQALQGRVDDLEVRLKKMAQRPATVYRTAASVKPSAVLEPPFRVVDIELRGGERFLSIASIASPGATLLAQMRLLGKGESDSGWQLQTLEARVAVFRVNGQTLRVAVP